MPFPETEITDIPPLTTNEQALLGWHGVLNVLGVLASELHALGARLGGDGSLCREGIGATMAVAQGIREQPAAELPAGWVERLAGTVTRELAASVLPLVGPERAAAAVAEVGDLLALLAARVQETSATAANPIEDWNAFFVEELQVEFRRVLAAMERIARGRYHIRVDQPRILGTDYCVRFRFLADRDTTIWMPRALIAVVRDLVANARKYTAPGGTIFADLNQAGGMLHFSIADDGRGIPAGEIAQVAQFGRRGSNVEDVRTLGGGFGLTKAFIVTRRHGGRFWIASALGQGTRIRLELPRPTAPRRE